MCYRGKREENFTRKVLQRTFLSGVSFVGFSRRRAKNTWGLDVGNFFFSSWKLRGLKRTKRASHSPQDYRYRKTSSPSLRTSHRGNVNFFFRLHLIF